MIQKAGPKNTKHKGGEYMYKQNLENHLIKTPNTKVENICSTDSVQTNFGGTSTNLSESSCFCHYLSQKNSHVP